MYVIIFRNSKTNTQTWIVPRNAIGTYPGTYGTGRSRCFSSISSRRHPTQWHEHPYRTRTVAKLRYKRFRNRLNANPNPLTAKSVSDNLPRRQKQKIVHRDLLTLTWVPSVGSSMFFNRIKRVFFYIYIRCSVKIVTASEMMFELVELRQTDNVIGLVTETE